MFVKIQTAEGQLRIEIELVAIWIVSSQLQDEIIAKKLLSIHTSINLFCSHKYQIVAIEKFSQFLGLLDLETDKLHNISNSNRFLDVDKRFSMMICTIMRRKYN